MQMFHSYKRRKGSGMVIMTPSYGFYAFVPLSQIRPLCLQGKHTQWLGDPKACLYAVEKRKISCPCQESKHGSSTDQSISSSSLNRLSDSGFL
jgi:hypothetical protein